MRDRVFAPLREMCARSIEEPKCIVGFTDDLISIVHSVGSCMIGQTSAGLEKLKGGVTMGQTGFAARTGIPSELQSKLNEHASARRKLSN